MIGVVVLFAGAALLDGTGDRRALVAAEIVSTASVIGAGIRGKTVSLWDAIFLESAAQDRFCVQEVVEVIIWTRL